MPGTPANQPKPAYSSRLRDGLVFAFGELLISIGPWLLLGIGIAGLIAGLVPDWLIERHLGDGIFPMIIMLAVGIPIFVCATSSTPIVAALALKGLSPGAALVFLLAGPVTNAATITVLAKLLGRRVTAVYVVVIAVVSLLLGIAVNGLYTGLGLDTAHWISDAAHEASNPFSVAASVVLVGMIVWHFARQKLAERRQRRRARTEGETASPCCNNA